MRTLLLPIVLSVSMTGHVYAGFEEAGAAYKSGDFVSAVNELTPLAERGDHRAMYALGSMYAAGQGVEADLNKAFELFFEAAQNGRIDAMYKLGLMYEEGLGIEQNYQKALKYYQKSAKQGYPLSQYRFGLMYSNGKGIRPNQITAYAWLVIAGHYFVYESGKTDKTSISADNVFEQQILLSREQEISRITDNIIEQMQHMRTGFSEADISQVRDKVTALSKYKKQYHDASVRNVTPDGDIEKMFLPDTLY